jgi:predicted ester cyclase
VTDELEASKERSRRLYEEVFGQGNYGAADELRATGVINHGPGSSPVPGTDGIEQQASLLRTAFPDLRVTLNDQFGAGDRVVSRWTDSGTHTGPLALPAGSVAATGNSNSLDGIRDRPPGQWPHRRFVVDPRPLHPEGPAWPAAAVPQPGRRADG